MSTTATESHLSPTPATAVTLFDPRQRDEQTLPQQQSYSYSSVTTSVQRPGDAQPTVTSFQQQVRRDPTGLYEVEARALRDAPDDHRRVGVRGQMSGAGADAPPREAFAFAETTARDEAFVYGEQELPLVEAQQRWNESTRALREQLRSSWLTPAEQQFQPAIVASRPTLQAHPLTAIATPTRSATADALSITNNGDRIPPRRGSQRALDRHRRELRRIFGTPPSLTASSDESGRRRRRGRQPRHHYWRPSLHP